MSRDFWQIYLGVRTSWVPNEAYNAFDTNDIISFATIGASRAILLSKRLSIAPGVVYESGAQRAKARGADAKLRAHRFGGVAEGRYQLGRDVYVLAKLIPQAIHTRSYLDDESWPATLQKRTWQLGLDASAGAAWNIPRTLGATNRYPQFWLVAETGYGWTMGKDLELSPDVDSDDPQARIKLDMGKLDLSGIMMRISVAGTF